MNNLRRYIKTLNRIHQKKKKIRLRNNKTDFYHEKIYIYNKLFFKYLILGLFKSTFRINFKYEILGYVQSPFGIKVELFLIKLCMKIKILKIIGPFGIINSIGNLFKMSLKTPYHYENLFSDMAKDVGFLVIDENLTSIKTQYTLRTIKQ
jgi:hypothetical protein